MKFKILIFFSIFFLALFALFALKAQAQEESFNIGYPAVDKIEMQVLGRTYPVENIYKRLDRLEMTMFKKTSNASLSDRVDKLSNFVQGNIKYSKNNNTSTILFNQGSQNYQGSQNFQGSQSYQGSQSFQGYQPHSSFNNSTNYPGEYSIILYNLEKDLLKTAYIAEPIDVRVTRLEKHIFSKTSEDYPIGERIQRLSAYADARESGEYYEDQSKIRQYNNVAIGVKALSVLFMILQALLL